MKAEPEPLKDKVVNKLKKGTGGYAGRGLRADYFERDDVASAVAWLKKELERLEYANTNIFKTIDEAFEDAVKEK